MRVLLFGTYDTSMHPRVATIAEGEAAMCRILAGRNWYRAEDGRILFGDDTDMQAANALRATLVPALEGAAARVRPLRGLRRRAWAAPVSFRKIVAAVLAVAVVAG